MRWAERGAGLPGILAALALAASALGSSPIAADDRGTEVLRFSCESQLARRDITLFANGTVRLREGNWQEEPAMFLEELGPDGLASHLELLREIADDTKDDPLEQPMTGVLSGPWAEMCDVYLKLPEQDGDLVYRFSVLEQVPLIVARLVDAAEQLVEDVRPPDPKDRLPQGYEPKFGDVLRSPEGQLFRVLGLTADEKGVELEGVDEPIRLFVALDDLSEAFVAIEERARAVPWDFEGQLRQTPFSQ